MNTHELRTKRNSKSRHRTRDSADRTPTPPTPLLAPPAARCVNARAPSAPVVPLCARTHIQYGFFAGARGLQASVCNGSDLRTIARNTAVFTRYGTHETYSLEGRTACSPSSPSYRSCTTRAAPRGHHRPPNLLGPRRFRLCWASSDLPEHSRTHLRRLLAPPRAQHAPSSSSAPARSHPDRTMYAGAPLSSIPKLATLRPRASPI
ncbi:hypothetical protein B0H16DRAFT_118624 [Mycena metata]|uniref:Uncharacterized protein n=1 Tax=Mycena metata TaxID=1033252 RepID=A0AAD7MXJ6_9AGAR|nr:hypothetical protein B0H16DRAFT_118624 [Mycena metata]